MAVVAVVHWIHQKHPNHHWQAPEQGPQTNPVEAVVEPGWRAEVAPWSVEVHVTFAAAEADAHQVVVVVAAGVAVEDDSPHLAQDRGCCLHTRPCHDTCVGSKREGAGHLGFPEAAGCALDAGHTWQAKEH